MFKIVRIFLLIMLAAVVPAAAGELTDSQKDELSAFIREYLMKNPEVLRDALQELDRRQAQADNAARKSALTAKAAAVFQSGGSDGPVGQDCGRADETPIGVARGVQ